MEKIYKSGYHPNFVEKRPDRSAPDNPGETATVTNRITIEQKEWLDAQPEGRSYHVRQALRMYINSISIPDINNRE
ncbi:MAG: hypothetical protein PUP93_05505 [Rhizonema sp. NSF051]|nr:hypothetical protein [Rhizonema sp. NSF051]